MSRVRQRVLQVRVVRLSPYHVRVVSPRRRWHQIVCPYQRMVAGMQLQDSVVPWHYAVLVIMHMHSQLRVSCQWPFPL